jgi:magnesium-transporting ATPase (P-type)
VIDDAALAAATARNVTLNEYEVVDFVPFESSTRYTQATLSAKERVERFFVRKGAVTTLLAQCTLTPEQRKEWNDQMLKCSSVGERTLAVVREKGSEGGIALPKKAASTITAGSSPVVEPVAGPELQFQFVGLISFTDPPRDDSKVIVLAFALSVTDLLLDCYLDPEPTWCSRSDDHR